MSLFRTSTIADGYQYPDQGIVMGQTGIGLQQGPLSTVKILARSFTESGLFGNGIENSYTDDNNQMARPIANLPIAIPWATDPHTQGPFDQSPGQLVFVNHEDRSRAQPQPAAEQKHQFKTPGALNNYCQYGDGRKKFRSVRSGHQMNEAWPLVAAAWTRNPNLGSAIASGPITDTYHINYMIEIHDYWCYNRKHDDRGHQIGCLEELHSHLFFVWRRVKEDPGCLPSGCLYVSEEDQYYWRVEPYHLNRGSDLTIDNAFFSDLNVSSPNYHQAYVINVGRCTQLINRVIPNSGFVQYAKQCLFPTKLDNDYILAYNRLPRIQVDLWGK